MRLMLLVTNGLDAVLVFTINSNCINYVLQSSLSSEMTHEKAQESLAMPSLSIARTYRLQSVPRATGVEAKHKHLYCITIH